MEVCFLRFHVWVEHYGTVTHSPWTSVQNTLCPTWWRRWYFCAHWHNFSVKRLLWVNLKTEGRGTLTPRQCPCKDLNACWQRSSRITIHSLSHSSKLMDPPLPTDDKSCLVPVSTDLGLGWTLNYCHKRGSEDQPLPQTSALWWSWRQSYEIWGQRKGQGPQRV